MRRVSTFGRLAGILALVLMPAALRADETQVKRLEKEGFVKLFDGKTLSGWKTADNPDSWTALPDGTIRGKGDRSHLFGPKYGRPSRPARGPGDDVEKRTGFGRKANDAPLARPTSKRLSVKTSPPGTGTDPFDPTVFNRSSRPAPKTKADAPSNSSAKPTRDPFSTIDIPVGRGRTTFEAAPPPINLRRVR